MNTVLILGASRGIGFEFARQYVQESWRVLATARDDEGCAKLQAVGAEAFKLDVAQPSSVSGLSWRLDGEKIDLALYVAGVMDRNSPQTPPTQQAFDELMHANVLGAMQALPQVAPWVAEAQGTFAFISSRMSSLALTDAGNAALYRVSKAALNMVVRTAP
ncbi:MAG: C-factor, partial [Pseudomonadota bacterium]